MKCFGKFDIQEYRDKALYGVTLEPLELALLTGQETLTLERSILGYQVPFPQQRYLFPGQYVAKGP